MTDRKTSPLRHLDISDDAVAQDIMAEKARELSGAYERIEELQTAIRELLWLIEVVGKRDDIPWEAARALTGNHRVSDARDSLR
jgi:hypothetical protein